MFSYLSIFGEERTFNLRFCEKAWTSYLNTSVEEWNLFPQILWRRIESIISVPVGRNGFANLRSSLPTPAQKWRTILTHILWKIMNSPTSGKKKTFTSFSSYEVKWTFPTQIMWKRMDSLTSDILLINRLPHFRS